MPPTMTNSRSSAVSRGSWREYQLLVDNRAVDTVVVRVGGNPRNRCFSTLRPRDKVKTSAPLPLSAARNPAALSPAPGASAAGTSATAATSSLFGEDAARPRWRERSFMHHRRRSPAWPYIHDHAAVEACALVQDSPDTAPSASNRSASDPIATPRSLLRAPWFGTIRAVPA